SSRATCATCAESPPTTTICTALILLRPLDRQRYPATARGHSARARFFHAAHSSVRFRGMAWSGHPVHRQPGDHFGAAADARDHDHVAAELGRAFAHG